MNQYEQRTTKRSTHRQDLRQKLHEMFTTWRQILRHFKCLYSRLHQAFPRYATRVILSPLSTALANTMVLPLLLKRYAGKQDVKDYRPALRSWSSQLQSLVDECFLVVGDDCMWVGHVRPSTLLNMGIAKEKQRKHQ